MGQQATFFFHTSCGDIAETEEAIALKLGYVRSSNMSPLSVQQLLDQKIVTPHGIDHRALRGNALVACFSKVEPCFAAYQTILAPLPLYYTRLGDGILCTTDPRYLLASLKQVQLNEDAIPMHFLFAFPLGSLTYFRDVWRLCPGQTMKWAGGGLDTRLVQDLRLPGDEPTFERLNAASFDAYYERMSQVMQAYLVELNERGQRPATLLSGGVDSCVLQVLVNEQLPPSERPVSFSYAVPVRSFELEIEYARHASELLQTQHTFFHISPQDFPDLLIRTVETLGQPNLYTESTVCQLALAEFLAANVPDVHCFFTGQGADGLHGAHEVKKVAFFETARTTPCAHSALRLAAALLAPLSKNASHGLHEIAEMLAAASNPASLTTPTIYLPTNYVAVFADLGLARRCFGDQAVLKAFDYRLNLEAEYLNSPSAMEKSQIIDLLASSYETAVVLGHVFSAQRRELIPFYLDEDVVRITLAFAPRVRFLKGLNTKPILKQILARKSCSTLAKKVKRGSVFIEDLYDWMRQGQLREMVQAIDLPGFVTRADFDEMVRNPNRFLWNLLTLDIFRKRVLKSTVYGKREVGPSEHRLQDPV